MSTPFYRKPPAVVHGIEDLDGVVVAVAACKHGVPTAHGGSAELAPGRPAGGAVAVGPGGRGCRGLQTRIRYTIGLTKR